LAELFKKALGREREKERKKERGERERHLEGSCNEWYINFINHWQWFIYLICGELKSKNIKTQFQTAV
jgi:hypothetical protein